VAPFWGTVCSARVVVERIAGPGHGVFGGRARDRSADLTLFRSDLASRRKGWLTMDYVWIPGQRLESVHFIALVCARLFRADSHPVGHAKGTELE
jgi:hypothetical protein